MNEPEIYNCHVHAFTTKHVPKYFFKLILGRFFGRLLSVLLRRKTPAQILLWLTKHAVPFTDKDLLERLGQFIDRGNVDHQANVLEGVMEQYPPSAKLVVLPMDMEFMDLGTIDESIDKQHQDLLELADQHKNKIIPFFAVDPRRKGIVAQLKSKLVEGKFRGVKIYPNLGYHPQDPTLLEIYDICQSRNIPIMTHCSPGGVWQYGLTYEDRVKLSHPRNYETILKDFLNLRICLAHFGGADEWIKHLKRKKPVAEENRAWVRWIADLIRTDKYPNLYTDISYTIFKSQPKGLLIDFFDYLKVLLEDPILHRQVLFGTDYYMVELESLTEREVSILLRSRLGNKMYFQIAHHNAKRYLGIEE